MGRFNPESMNQRAADIPAGAVEVCRFHVETFAAGRNGHLSLVSKSKPSEESARGVNVGKKYANRFRRPRECRKSCQ